MTWIHACIIMACLASVITCGLHVGCVAVLPQIVTLVTFIVGGVAGDARGSSASVVTKDSVKNVDSH